ncbi:SIR2 family NAD-dependent protein deacylase [Sphingobacterium psychroaquaticum]|uniref:NAD-dependent protein deacylase n=1 Tax=Sphingobacterium psychroaquaticum TaxID=561061 RepID=A0A1X7IIR8_9SPHI|nr:NAD-dependent deacylase [Sphingobacterium psychroaquaticum]SMG14359.1 NAD-dependent deacetylase [Sphingobacterium psychroaquaticum]
MKKKLVVFTGAGISAESGLKTFRGSDGLWEGYNIEEVATPAGWKKDPALVLEFYNLRRKQCVEAQPNAAHLALVDFEALYDVKVITQNIDDLHERAGSRCVLHLHGEIRKAQSSLSPRFVYRMETDEIRMGDSCELGSQLRPHVVWFGEAVPNLEKAIDITAEADIFVVIGTSLQVYPAATLLQETNAGCKVYLLDPNADQISVPSHVVRIAKNAGEGVEELRVLLAE